MSSSEKQTGAGLSLLQRACLVLLILYFVFPVVFLIPLRIFYRDPRKAPLAFLQAYDVFFWPNAWLQAQVPWYERLIQAEIKFMRATTRFWR